MNIFNNTKQENNLSLVMISNEPILNSNEPATISVTQGNNTIILTIDQIRDLVNTAGLTIMPTALTDFEQLKSMFRESSDQGAYSYGFTCDECGNSVKARDRQKLVRNNSARTLCWTCMNTGVSFNL